MTIQFGARYLCDNYEQAVRCWQALPGDEAVDAVIARHPGFEQTAVLTNQGRRHADVFRMRSEGEPTFSPKANHMALIMIKNPAELLDAVMDIYEMLLPRERATPDPRDWPEL